MTTAIDDFDKWIDCLNEDVIQSEFGYEEGEFTVYPSMWRGLYEEGLAPRQAWLRALDAHKAARDEDEAARLANWRRIQDSDAAVLALSTTL